MSGVATLRQVASLIQNQWPDSPEYAISYDMVMTKRSDGRPLGILVILDEYARECLALYVARGMSSQNVLD